MTSEVLNEKLLPNTPLYTFITILVNKLIGICVAFGDSLSHSGSWILMLRLFHPVPDPEVILINTNRITLYHLKAGV